MDNDTLRVTNWREGFFKSLENGNEDLIPLFPGRIHFMPQQDKEGSIHPALMELDERYATEDQIKRMWILFEAYGSEHRV